MSEPGGQYIEREVVRRDVAAGDAQVVEHHVVAPVVAERRVVTRRRFDPAAVLAVIGRSHSAWSAPWPSPGPD